STLVARAGLVAQCTTASTSTQASSTPSPVIRSARAHSNTVACPSGRGCRLIRRGWCPAACSCAATLAPSPPVAPVTSTRITHYLASYWSGGQHALLHARPLCAHTPFRHGVTEEGLPVSFGEKGPIRMFRTLGRVVLGLP